MKRLIPLALAAALLLSACAQAPLGAPDALDALFNAPAPTSDPLTLYMRLAGLEST